MMMIYHGDKRCIFHVLPVFIVFVARCVTAKDACPGAQDTSPIGLGQQGLHYSKSGQEDLALSCFEESRRLDPHNFQTLANLGVLYDRGRRVRDASEAYGMAAKHAPPPHRPRILGLYGSASTRGGQHSQAVTVFEEMVQLGASLTPTDRFNFAVSLGAVGRAADATLQYEAILETEPNDPSALVNLGARYRDNPATQSKALSLLQRAVRVQPGMAEAWYNLGAVQELVRAGQRGEALASYTEAIKLRPSLGEAYLARGQLYQGQGELSLALKDLRQATKLLPHMPRTHTALAIVIKELGGPGALREAESILRQVIANHPTYPYSYLNLAQMIRHGGEEGSQRKAIKLLDQAAQHSPKTAEVWGTWGDLLLDKREYDTAMEYLARADDLDGDNNAYFCHLLVAKYITCTWEGREQDHARMREVLYQQVVTDANSSSECIHPFIAVTYPLSMDDQLAISRKHARIARSKVKSLPRYTSYPHVPNITNPGSQSRPRLRIGYASSEIRNHPLSMLLEKQLVGHDTSRFEVFIYALTPDNLELVTRDQTQFRMRSSIMERAEHFRDMSQKTVPEIAQQMHEDGLHILINLDGYTSTHERPQLYELTPAPIQMSFMGYAATMGTDNTQYLVTDRIATPPIISDKYSEKYFYMPHSYYLNNHKGRWPDVENTLPPRERTRSHWGLPEDSFIFANFGRNQKYSPELFDTWSRIMKRVPNSVLWMLRYPKEAERNIRAAMTTRGIGHDRLIFSSKIGMELHMSRSTLADLILDTSGYNGHTTIVDCLWAGLPMVTHRGAGAMVGKVAASLAFALGIPSMVTESMSEYEELAVRLANNPAELKALRARIKELKSTSPLFDSDRWMRDYESGLQQAWELHTLSESSEHSWPHIVVSDTQIARESSHSSGATSAASTTRVKQQERQVDDRARHELEEVPLIRPAEDREYGHDDRNNMVPREDITAVGRDTQARDEPLDLPPFPAGSGAS